MLRPHAVSPYNQLKSKYLNVEKYLPEYWTEIMIQEDKSLHALYFRESEFLNAGKITPTSQKEEADLKVKKAIVQAINTNDTKTLQRLLKRSSMETKKAGHGDGPFSEIPIVAANLYSLIYLANQPHCTPQTRETIYHCLAKEENYLPYLASFFTTEPIEIFSYDNGHNYRFFLFTKLHLAAALNLKEKVQQLLKQYGANRKDAYSCGCFSTTVLGWAAAFGQLEMVKFLHSIGAKLKADYCLTPPYHSSTPAFITYVTLSERHDAVTRYLLDNVTLKNPIDFLMTAAALNNLPILKYAFEKFQIPFSTLIEKNAYPIIFALIEAGVELPADAPEDLRDAALLWQKEAMLASTATPAAAAAAISQAPTDSDDCPAMSTSSQRP